MDYSKTNKIKMNILQNIASSANVIKAHTALRALQVHFLPSELLLAQFTSLLCSLHSGEACLSPVLLACVLLHANTVFSSNLMITD